MRETGSSAKGILAYLRKRTGKKTTLKDYKLFSFAVTDFFGKGQYVMHALVKTESKDNLQHAIDFFKDNNPTWRKIQVFVTDKAFHEKAVLAEEFPAARQLLCMFHVVAWLEKQVARLSTGSQEVAEDDYLLLLV
eukprot:jgi/Phyca11/14088/fgenesh1_pg.PHYCAscaffold_6_\